MSDEKTSRADVKRDGRKVGMLTFEAPGLTNALVIMLVLWLLVGIVGIVLAWPHTGVWGRALHIGLFAASVFSIIPMMVAEENQQTSIFGSTIVQIARQIDADVRIIDDDDTETIYRLDRMGATADVGDEV